jgi:REP element-mobilizing transposase RayT
MKGISERYEFAINEIDYDKNHIHIFCGAPPSMATDEDFGYYQIHYTKKSFSSISKIHEKNCGVVRSGARANI